jgi:glutathione synthase
MMQCFPSPFPRAKFQQALEIQKIYNRLYCAVAADEQWIYNAIQDLIPDEPLAVALWGIHEAAKEMGYRQDISGGIFRSDYMLHLNEGVTPDAPNAMFETSLKQVEMNTFGNMHRYLTWTGIYNANETSLDPKSLPVNRNIESIASCLALAHTTYGRVRSQEARQTAVLMIVQPDNVSASTIISV